MEVSVIGVVNAYCCQCGLFSRIGPLLHLSRCLCLSTAACLSHCRSLLSTSMFEHLSMGQARNPPTKRTIRCVQSVLQCPPWPCRHRVSSPRDWAVSAGSHMLDTVHMQKTTIHLHRNTLVLIKYFWWSERFERKMLICSNFRVSDRLVRKRLVFTD